MLILPVFTTAEPSDSQGNAVIIMNSEGFSPAEITIKQGDSITFKNKDGVDRWPASNLHPTHTQYPGSDITDCNTSRATKIFDSCGNVVPESEYTFTFNEEGAWSYHDHLVPRFRGEITVLKDEGFVYPDTEFTDKEKESNIFKDIADLFLLYWHKIYFGLFTDEGDEYLDRYDLKFVAFDKAKTTYLMKLYGKDRLFNKLVEDSSDEFLGCHLEAHLLGRVAATIEEISPFSVFDTRCQSGFYHGILEQHVGSLPSGDIFNALFDHCRSLDDKMRRVQCFHGMGHGLVVYYDYDLPKATGMCLTLPDERHQKLCNVGAYMENATTLLYFSVEQGHYSEWVDEDDSFFPCNSFEDNNPSLSSCYGIQPLIMLQQTDYNYDEVTEMCRSVPEKYKTSCFWGIGFFAAAPPSTPDVDFLGELCQLDADNESIGCAHGVIEELVYVWGPEWYEEAELFCNKLSTEASTSCSKKFVEIKE